MWEEGEECDCGTEVVSGRKVRSVTVRLRR